MGPLRSKLKPRRCVRVVERAFETFRESHCMKSHPDLGSVGSTRKDPRHHMAQAPSVGGKRASRRKPCVNANKHPQP